MRKFFIFLFLLVSVFPAAGQNIGIGIINPTDRLHINSPLGQNAFRVSVNSTTKFRIWENGGAAIGTTATPPGNGLLVQGPLQPNNGISSPNKIIIECSLDSLIFRAGQSQIILAPNGNVTIRSLGKLVLESVASDLELRGLNVRITAAATAFINGTVINLNGNSRAVAGVGNTTFGTAPPGGGPVTSLITTGSTTVFIGN